MRFPLLDVIRGFSLFGIFLMNVASFSGFGFMSPEQMAAIPTAAVDRPIGLVLLWLANGKFYSLFSLLFGIGFALQIDAAGTTNAPRLVSFGMIPEQAVELVAQIEADRA